MKIRMALALLALVSPAFIDGAPRNIGGALAQSLPTPNLGTNTKINGTAIGAIPFTVPKGGTGLASGTSGGIPYFDSATTMSSSAVLAANAVVVGGGAGAAPKTSNVALTAPASLATLTLGSGKTATISNTLTFNGIDGSTVDFGAGGTVLYGNQSITLSGDASGSGATAITVTSLKVNGVNYPASPSTNTVPLVTASNTVTYTGTTGTGNIVRANQPTFTTRISATGDDSAVVPQQYLLAGATNGQKQLAIGFNTTSNFGSIQAIWQGTAYEPLWLNGSGGIVGVGTTNAVGGQGEFALSKQTASGSAPGAGNLKLAVVAGTNAGSCKIIAYAGTSTTAVTVVDNVGAGC
jgi:hypothetical protein